jgi:hypothetical protein
MVGSITIVAFCPSFKGKLLVSASKTSELIRLASHGDGLVDVVEAMFAVEAEAELSGFAATSLLATGELDQPVTLWMKLENISANLAVTTDAMRQLKS